MAAFSTSIASAPAELAALCDLSARIGADPWRTQGAGGNTSIKSGDTLWIKASGMWLKDARQQNIFTAVSLEKVLRAFRDGTNCEDLTWACTLPENSLRPSIETVIHAIINWPVVIHLHSVWTIAWAVQEDGEQILRDKLRGLPWTWVPYKRPGAPLAAEIQRRIQSETQIIVCGNHGLFIAANSCEEAETLLLEVERRLTIKHRSVEVDHPKLRVPEGWMHPQYEEIFALAVDSISFELSQRGALYPDHVVFLGVSSNSTDTPYRIVPDQGVLVSSTARRGAQEMLLCWALVLSCLDANTPLRTLSSIEANELVNWEAEKYRQALK